MTATIERRRERGRDRGPAMQMIDPSQFVGCACSPGVPCLACFDRLPKREQRAVADRLGIRPARF